MNKTEARKILRQWVRDLESGKYRQGAGDLVIRDMDTDDITGYCCLGVLTCAPKYKGRRRKWIDPSRGGLHLDHSTVQKLGITGDVHNTLVDMNDGTPTNGPQRSFKYIAKWIRKNLLDEKVRVR